MATNTPVVKSATVNGVEIKIHACPWSLYKKLYSKENPTTAETLSIIEEIARECTETVGDPNTDVISSASRSQISRIFELAVSVDEDTKPDF